MPRRRSGFSVSERDIFVNCSDHSGVNPLGNPTGPQFWQPHRCSRSSSGHLSLRCSCGTDIELWRSQLAERIYLNCRKCAPVEGKWAMTRDNSAHARVYKARKGKLKYLRTGEMQSYLSMVARCNCKTNHAYENYGGRGVRVCERWMSGSHGQASRISAPIWDRVRLEKRWTAKIHRDTTNQPTAVGLTLKPRHKIAAVCCIRMVTNQN